MKRIIRLCILLCLAGTASAQDMDTADDGELEILESQEVNVDPWIGMNKITHGFNDTADRIVLRPLAKAYRAVTPGFLRRGIGNFFANINDVNNGTNNLLQGKVAAGLGDFARLLINTTIGIGGLFDPASGFGLEKHEESIGQTLTRWGVPPGPYLVVPFLGPRTLTDALSAPLNTALDGVRYLYPVAHRNVLFAIRAIDRREALLSAEGLIIGEKYRFYRDAYLQRRHYLVMDGNVEDDFDDF